MNKKALNCKVLKVMLESLKKGGNMEFSKRLNLLILGFIFFINSILCYGKITYLYTDFGREAFYPLAILQGDVLYKDIFNIYGPFSYLFNAFLYQIFGANINTLYIAGIISSLLMLCFTYLICRFFSDKLTSSAIVLFIMQTIVFSKFLMNFIQPYSFAVTYGICAMLISAFCYLKYTQTQKSIYTGFAAFFAGVAFVNKYEFFFYPVLLFLFIIIFEKRKNLIRDITLFALPGGISFGFLFMRGLNCADLIDNSKLVLQCAQTNAYQYFTKNSMGFSVEGIITSLLSIIFLITLFFVLKFISSKIKNYAYYLILPLGLILFLSKTQNFLFQGLPILLIILFCFNIKKTFSSKENLFIFLCAILFSLKSIIALIIPNGYGTYSLPLLLLALAVIIQFWSSKTDVKKSIVIILCSAALANTFMNILLIKDRTYEIKSPAGTIKNTQKAADSYNKLINYVQHSTKPADKIIVLPETPLLNFLTNRKSDNYYNDFTPDRLEAYSEERIIKRYKQQPPEYFILIKIPQKPYGKRAFSEDYGTKVFNWISKNYTLEQTISDDIPILIFKKI